MEETSESSVDFKQAGALLIKQKRHRDSIENSLSNFKKVGKNNWTPAKVRSRIQLLTESWQAFQNGHDQLCGLVPDAEREIFPYFAEDHISKVEQVILDTLDFMRDALETLEPSTSSSPAKVSSAINEDLTQTVTPAPALSPLPPIRLPPFDGNYDEWESFRDRFVSLVHQNKTLTDFTRMHYLVTSVSGCALDSIKSLSVTADNYTLAWETLVKRFENPRRLVSTHLASLLTLPAVTRENASDLQALRDRVTQIVSSLLKLNRQPADLWDDILVHLVSQRLDASTRKAWTLHQSDKTFPSFSEMKEFLSSRARALEELNVGSHKVGAKPAITPRVTVANTSIVASSEKCPLCRGSHFINACSNFARLSINDRRDVVRRHKRCFNCLSAMHTVTECPSRYSCRTCQKRHHSMLHLNSPAKPNAHTVHPENPSSGTSAKLDAPVLHMNSISKGLSTVMLATAWLTVGVGNGRTAVVRALLDQGSALTFISENLAQLLRVSRVRLPVSVTAVGGIHVGTPRHAAKIFVSPRNSLVPAFSATAAILKTLTSYAPPTVPSITSFPHLCNLELADSDPTSSAKIDVIIGADLYADVLLEGMRKGKSGQPMAQNTIFGWVLSGSRKSALSHSSSTDSIFNSVSVNHCSIDDGLTEEIKRFWNLEEIPAERILKPCEIKCEEHFKSTHYRNNSGRYVIRLPFKTTPPINIGYSHSTAVRLSASLQRRFNLNKDLRDEYRNFMAEYERLGHMVKVSPPQNLNSQIVYIPHHPVVREGSATTRVRVVFNASCPTSNGTSLNDHLLTGPKLQSELSAVILRWRQCKFVYSTDIEKMYRQIAVDSRDVDYQRILWRSDFGIEASEYQLMTVTYGMVCAPFLALRVLQQLVRDEGHVFPLAANVLRDNIYVDDLLFGAESLESLKIIRNQLIQLLKRGGFSLRKWASNSSSLLSDIDPHDHGLACDRILSEDQRVKVLGIAWNPKHDSFQYSVEPFSSAIVSKRSILSFIARLYDPLGWVTPAIITTKIFMQILWRESIGWDDPVTNTLACRWHSIAEGLLHLKGLTIPRWTSFASGLRTIELHGFADASNVAYAAAVYLRTVSLSGRVTITLLAGKSRVAPIIPVTVPRLELCAALLLARLIQFIANTLNLASSPCYCWTDSTVALEWITQHPSRWKVFVAHRVAKIQALLPHAEWRHIPTECNPADCASRGLLGFELLTHTLWWTGPSWLYQDEENWPKGSNESPQDALIEERVNHQLCAHAVEAWDLATHFSSWPKLLRVTAYVFRFLSRCRRQHDTSRPSNSMSLSSAEFQKARKFWIKHVQSQLFPDEISCLQRKVILPSRSPLCALRPFLDEEQIIRVGGRLSYAPYPYNIRHPIILAAHPLVTLIITQAHLRALHGGPQLTLHLLRREFWILRARGLVRSVTRQCVKCVRERAAMPSQVMGNLPNVRVVPSLRSFLHCGVDYAGPVSVRASLGRGNKCTKAYIALFICLVTKAIHLELVSSYATSAFVSAFARFCSRRGLPESMYCDNGTNFVGASHELDRAYRAAIKDPNFLNSTLADKIAWHFIPPSAPHFGGLWEAGVKSVKSHLSKVVGDRSLTFEELYTLLCRIEACLNSRPLVPLSDSPDDYECLTPGHFTVGAPLTVPPEPSVLELNANRLSRWQLVLQMTERFWKLWQHDVINTLHQRSKWRKVQPPVEVGRVVLMRNSSLPPCKWELGRIIQCHPGDDGLTRVVTVKTATSQFKRPINKLCLLPVCDNSSGSDAT